MDAMILNFIFSIFDTHLTEQAVGFATAACIFPAFSSAAPAPISLGAVVGSGSSSSFITPAWVLVLLLLSLGANIVIGLFLVTLKASFQRDAEDRKAIWERFKEGEKQFARLHKANADIAVHQAIESGDFRAEMAREFVTRREHQKQWDRLTAIELSLGKSVTRLETIVEQIGKKIDQLEEAQAA